MFAAAGEKGVGFADPGRGGLRASGRLTHHALRVGDLDPFAL